MKRSMAAMAMRESLGYTLADIERMRAVVHGRNTADMMFDGSNWVNALPGNRPGFYTPRPGIRRADMTVMIEEELRTYIAAGIRPDELEGKK